MCGVCVSVCVYCVQACVRARVCVCELERECECVWLSVCLCVLESQQCPSEMCSLQLTVERTQSTER